MIVTIRHRWWHPKRWLRIPKKRVRLEKRDIGPPPKRRPYICELDREPLARKIGGPYG